MLVSDTSKCALIYTIQSSRPISN